MTIIHSAPSAFRCSSSAASTLVLSYMKFIYTRDKTHWFEHKFFYVLPLALSQNSINQYVCFSIIFLLYSFRHRLYSYLLFYLPPPHRHPHTICVDSFLYYFYLFFPLCFTGYSSINLRTHYIARVSLGIFFSTLYCKLPFFISI